MKIPNKLFSPIKIGTMKVKNRIVMAPMTTIWANDDGSIPPKLKNYFEDRAKGGTGLIVTEVASIDQSVPYQMQTLGIWDDTLIPAWRELADAVHAHGAKLAPQIQHVGPESLSFLHGIQPVGPSCVMSKMTGQMCRELTIEEIEKIIDKHGEAARRAREAGCDAVALHAAHNYQLLGSFLSPLRNKRTDAYGGSIEGWLKLPLEVIKRVKAMAGDDFPIILRISGDEMVPGGRTLYETQYIAPILAEAGVDAFETSGGTMDHGFWRIIPPLGTPPGMNVSFSAALKEVVDVPIIVVGRINDPLFAESILQKNQADLVSLGRALLADPEFANKAAEGRFDDIAPCVGCLQGCIGSHFKMEQMTCLINPVLGKEKEMIITPATKRKKVMVVGGGPGGLKAAHVAALRGHQVTLYEKEAKLGGQFNLAIVPPMKQELSKTIKYLSTQVEKAGIEVCLNTEVTPDLVDKMKPDVVIVATGGRALVPDIPGVDGEKVFTAHDLLTGKVSLHHGNVLIIGGGMIGCEVADLLANPGDNILQGRTTITIVEMLNDIGLDILPQSRMLLMPRLRERGINAVTSATVKEIVEGGVIIVKKGKGGQEEFIRDMDFIILAVGSESVDELSQHIKNKVPQVYVIGDAKMPRDALVAIAEGSEVGRKI